jgi:hypothetical protein
MPPGQITTTELETAILERLAKERGIPALAQMQLHVLSRKFTGVGSFTEFRQGAALPDLSDGPLSLGAIISVPGVPHGLSAVLFVKAGYPKCLEVFAFGEELWDGAADGFYFPSAA